RRTHRRRIVEVGLKHAEIRGLAPGGGDVEAVAIAAHAGPLRHQLEVRLLVVGSEVVRVSGRRIEDHEPVHVAHCSRTTARPARPIRARCRFVPGADESGSDLAWLLPDYGYTSSVFRGMMAALAVMAVSVMATVGLLLTRHFLFAAGAALCAGLA